MGGKNESNLVRIPPDSDQRLLDIILYFIYQLVKDVKIHNVGEPLNSHLVVLYFQKQIHKIHKDNQLAILTWLKITIAGYHERQGEWNI